MTGGLTGFLDFAFEGELPLWTWLAISAAAFPFISAMRGSKREREPLGQWSWVWRATAWLAIGFYSLRSIRYLSLNTFADHVEPQIASVSWLFARGQPLYPDLDSPQVYSNPYGPYLYLIPALFMKALGPGVQAAKAASTLASLASPWVLFRVLRDRLRKEWLWPAFALAALLFCEGGIFVEWMRAEPMLIFLSLCALAWPRAEVVGACLGIGVGLKVTAAPYFIPALAWLWERDRTGRGPGRGLALALATGLAVTLAPFLLPGVSLGNYLELLKLAAATHGIDPVQSGYAMERGLLYLLPALACVAGLKERRAFFSKYWLFLLAVLGAWLAAVRTASLLGSWTYPLIPVFPALLVASGLALAGKAEGFAGRARLAAAGGFVLMIAAKLALAQAAAGADIEDLRSRALTEDIEAILKSLPGESIGMGYAGDPVFSNMRPLLVFAGRTKLYLDEAALMGWQQYGLKLPEATLEAIARCENRVWLFPRGTSLPFDFNSQYPGQEPLFNDAFRALFLRHYKLMGHVRNYDAWECAAR